jgi:membrane fusion protein, multidrug efflux system
MKRNPKLFYPLGVLLAGALVAAILIATRPSPDVQPPRVPPPLVRAQVINRQDVRLRVRSQGTVAARTQSGLLSQVAGQIVEISPAFAGGGFFKSGDVLVTVDPRDYELAVARARAQVAQAKVRLAREEEESGLALEEWERVGRGEPSQLVLRKPQLLEARAGVEAAQASLEQAELALERTRVKAPYDGRVLARSVDVGQFVSPGAPLGRIYAVDFAEVRLSVPHGELAFLDFSLRFRDEAELPSQPEVLLHGDFAGGQHTWSGRIVRLEGQIDPLTRMVNLVARVPRPYDRSPDSDRPPLLVGLFVEAEILGQVASQVAVLPRSAIRGTDQVLVIDEENRLHYRKVDVLRAEKTSVLIQGGLSDGERVCLSPLDAVVEGMKVRIAGGTEDDDGSTPAGGYQTHSGSSGGGTV